MQEGQVPSQGGTAGGEAQGTRAWPSLTPQCLAGKDSPRGALGVCFWPQKCHCKRKLNPAGTK